MNLLIDIFLHFIFLVRIIRMKNIKISSFIYILITIFLIIDFIGYKFIYNTIISNHEKDTTILFYKIKYSTEIRRQAMHNKAFSKLLEQLKKLTPSQKDKPLDGDIVCSIILNV